MEAFASVQDVIQRYRPLTAEETEKAEVMLSAVSGVLRQYAKNTGRDLDEMIASGELEEGAVRSVTVDVTVRTLETQTASAPMIMTQQSQSALGYSVSGTYLNPGGGIFVKKSELKLLGLLRQRLGVIDFV